jgi:chromosome segregation ATPase
MTTMIEVSLKSLTRILLSARRAKRRVKSITADYNQGEDALAELRMHYDDAIASNTKLHRELLELKQGQDKREGESRYQEALRAYERLQASHQALQCEHEAVQRANAALNTLAQNDKKAIERIADELTTCMSNSSSRYDAYKHATKRAEEAERVLRDAATAACKFNMNEPAIRNTLYNLLRPWLPKAHQPVPAAVETQDAPKVEESDE